MMRGSRALVNPFNFRMGRDPLGVGER